MAADVEAGVLARKLHGVAERAAVRHERGGAQNAVLISLDDPGVHVAREAEIIGVNDEPADWSLLGERHY